MSGREEKARANARDHLWESRTGDDRPGRPGEGASGLDSEGDNGIDSTTE